MLDDIATRVSDTDVLYALSIISGQSGYVRPTFTTSKAINIIDSYHPILETTLKQHDIIANDVKLSETGRCHYLNRPKHGRKIDLHETGRFNRDSWLRWVVTFVPNKATLPLFDAIYTRMGASDDILMGQSTFMIEMSEANYALSRATKHSLILFDEIGRGTSTYDGMAIAKAIIEYIATKIKATCIFYPLS